MSKKAEKSCETEDNERYEAEGDDEVEYYVKAFNRLDKTGKHTWNWSAFFGGITWMLYRKMYLYAFVLTIVYLGMDLCLIENAAHWKGIDGSVSMELIRQIEPIIPRMCLMFLMFCLRDIYHELAHHLVNGWASFENWEIWTIAVFAAFVISRVCLGYFGNSLYYRIVKKRVREGYHLADGFSPTSILSCFGSLFFLLGLVSPSSSEIYTVNRESIRAYLNPNKRKN